MVISTSTNTEHLSIEISDSQNAIPPLYLQISVSEFSPVEFVLRTTADIENSSVDHTVSLHSHCLVEFASATELVLAGRSKSSLLSDVDGNFTLCLTRPDPAMSQLVVSGKCNLRGPFGGSGVDTQLCAFSFEGVESNIQYLRQMVDVIRVFVTNSGAG